VLAVVLLTIEETMHAILGAPDGVDRRDYASALKLELEASIAREAGDLDRAASREAAADKIWLRATSRMLLRSGSLC
jgi:hypothetical protein